MTTLEDNRFRLVLLAAKRAKQLIDGARRTLDLEVENPLTMALAEIDRKTVDEQTINSFTERRDLSELYAEEVRRSQPQLEAALAREDDEEDDE